MASIFTVSMFYVQTPIFYLSTIIITPGILGPKEPLRYSALNPLNSVPLFNMVISNAAHTSQKKKCIFLFLESFLSYYKLFLPTHCRCRGLRLHLITICDTHTHTHTHTYTHRRTPLEKVSTHRRALFLRTHNTRKRHTFMPSARFEPTIPASVRPQTHAFDHAATGIGFGNDKKQK